MESANDKFDRLIDAAIVNDPQNIDELSIMFDAFLGEDYPKEKRKQVAAIQKLLIEQLSELDEKSMTRGDFTKKINAVTNNASNELIEVLGREDFFALFGSHKL